jgi:hypothetical protein
VLRGWTQKRFRNRYHEIKHTHARELEDIVANSAIDVALQMHDAENALLKQTMAGIPNMNGWTPAWLCATSASRSASKPTWLCS